MNKKLYLLVMVVAVSAGIVSPRAHHVHPAAEWDLNLPVSVEGTVRQVYWGSPHVWFKIVTQETREYHVEWLDASQLAAYGMQTSPITEGERVIFTGAPNRNPEQRILVRLTEIRRPVDGWRWTEGR